MARCACPLVGKPKAPDWPPPEPYGSGLFQQRYFGDLIQIRITGMTPSLSSIQQQKKALRKEMRRRRRSLSPLQQRQASKNFSRLLRSSPLFRFSKRIAFTMARDGEIDPAPLMQTALQRGKHCYLPVMSRFGPPRLEFRRWQAGQRLVNGAWAIPEPCGRRCPARVLNRVLTPLVAFDPHGNRLGMGKGFYDRSFAFLRRSSAQRPLLLGMAHECQRVERLEVASWDVPLRGIVTDRRWYGSSAD